MSWESSCYFPPIFSLLPSTLGFSIARALLTLYPTSVINRLALPTIVFSLLPHGALKYWTLLSSQTLVWLCTLSAALMSTQSQDANFPTHFTNPLGLTDSFPGHPHQDLCLLHMHQFYFNSDSVQLNCNLIKHHPHSSFPDNSCWLASSIPAISGID